MPLADRVRPKSIDDMVGQSHLFGQGKVLRNIVESGNIPNMILYGPPGTGKTTFANIVAKIANKKYVKLNATTSSVKDIQGVIKELDTLEGYNGILLYIDEIQGYSKRQQSVLLEFMEKGDITLIASTADNPYFVVYKAIISRSHVFEFKEILSKDIEEGLVKVMKREVTYFQDIAFEEGIFKYISEISNGDMRTALNRLELALMSGKLNDNGKIEICLKDVIDLSNVKIMNYDRAGEEHYNLLSAFQKSIRGSDENAAIHYLARLIKAGDLQSIIRRILVISAEDIGLACPGALTFANNGVDAALKVGLPECRIILAEIVIYLCKCPKSNSAYMAIDRALNDLENKDVGMIPSSLKDSHYSSAKCLERGLGYKYPHNYEYHYVEQQYLPDSIKSVQYYYPGKNKQERRFVEYWTMVKEKRSE